MSSIDISGKGGSKQTVNPFKTGTSSTAGTSSHLGYSYSESRLPEDPSLGASKPAETTAQQGVKSGVVGSSEPQQEQGTTQSVPKLTKVKTPPKEKEATAFDPTTYVTGSYSGYGTGIHRPPITKNIQLVPHSVYVLCGPPMCGKSTFSMRMEALCRAWAFSKITLSSDGLRKELKDYSNVISSTDDTYSNRHSDSHLALSTQSFSLLMTKFEQVISHPVSTEIVIIDTTGFNDSFRAEVVAKAKAQNYRTVLVTFEYKTRAEYIPSSSSPEEKQMIEAAVDKFRKKVLPSIKSSMFDERISLRNRQEASNLVFNLKDHSMGDLIDNMSSFRLSGKALSFEPQPYVVIGDSHECVDELKELVSVAQSKYPKAIFIHVGDFLDKGGNTKEMVDYMHDRVANGPHRLLSGNHESFILGRLEGKISPIDPEIERSQFGSLKFFQENPEYVEKLKEIVDESLPFAMIRGFKGTAPVFITHAPCKNNELGKIHARCISAQRNFRTKDRSLSVQENLAWFYEEANDIHPLHIVGHTNHLANNLAGIKYKNKVFLDTSCVYGGALSAVVVSGGRIVEMISIPAKKVYVGNREDQPRNLGRYKKAVPFDINSFDLTFNDFRKINQAQANGIRFVSGTMAPGPSSDKEIEPLKAALEMLAAKGVKKIEMQPKYMGSRCQIYFYKGAPHKTMAVSRSGWKISKVDEQYQEQFVPFLHGLYKRYENIIESVGDMILDGELLPWRCLAMSAIDKDFASYVDSAEQELKILDADAENVPELGKFWNSLAIGQRLKGIKEFRETLEVFTKAGELEFKPFNVLWAQNEEKLKERGLKGPENSWKICPHDVALNQEDLWENPEIRELVGYMTVDPNDSISVAKAGLMFSALTKQLKMEGVVLKPIDVEINPDKNQYGVPSAIKVRSAEYLKLVYGFDYELRLEALCRQKKIRAKMRTSMVEEDLGMKMLNSTSPESWKENLITLIGEIKKEEELDPRL